jgi:glycosyltransferase involved in cell wall biosynthesis
MKVFYSCLSKSWGGMEMITLTFIKKLLERNIRVELLCIEESRMHIEANNMGIIIHSVKAAGYFHPFTTIRISNILERGSYDLVHTQASKDLWLLVPALKLRKIDIPLFLTKQVGSFIVKKDLLHKFLYNRVTKAFAISTIIKNNLIETTPLSIDKIELLYNAIDTKRFDPDKTDRNKLRKEYNLTNSDLVLGMIARFTPGKGHEEFIEAAEILSAKYEHLKFLIVGEASRGEDVYAKKIKQMAADKKLSNIIFTGFRSDTPDVLAAMDIFIFPSHAEAFGIALAEALSMGIPSVCANADGVLDVAVDGETSLLFQNKNSRDLADKTELLINDESKRKKMSIASRERAVKMFDINLIMDQTIKFYEQETKNNRYNGR